MEVPCSSATFFEARDATLTLRPASHCLNTDGTLPSTVLLDSQKRFRFLPDIVACSQERENSPICSAGSCSNFYQQAKVINVPKNASHGTDVLEKMVLVIPLGDAPVSLSPSSRGDAKAFSCPVDSGRPNCVLSGDDVELSDHSPLIPEAATRERQGSTDQGNQSCTGASFSGALSAEEGDHFSPGREKNNEQTDMSPSIQGAPPVVPSAVSFLLGGASRLIGTACPTRVSSLFLPSAPLLDIHKDAPKQPETLAQSTQPSVYTSPLGALSAMLPQGEVVVRREELDRWNAQVQALEFKCRNTADQLRTKTAEAAGNHKKWLRERRTNEELTTRITQDLKNRRTLESIVAAAQQELAAEKERSDRLHKDKRDLCRTINKLKEKLSRREDDLNLLHKQAETIDGDRAKAESKVKAYKKNLQGMSDLQNSLTDELAAARMEKKEVKTIFREQLVKIRKEQDELKEEAAKHQSVVQAWMDQVAKLRQEVDATELENHRLREQLSEIRTIANELTLQKEELSTEYRQQMQANEKMQTELTATRERLDNLERRRRQNQREWMREHLELTDQRIEAKAAASTKCDASAQASLITTFGDPFLPSDLVTRYASSAGATSLWNNSSAPGISMRNKALLC